MLPPWPTVVILDDDMALWNLGEDAASEKVRDIGERCAEPGWGFWTRPGLPMPEDRILRSVWSLLLLLFPPGEGMPPLYEALLLKELALRVAGRFCLRAAMLD